MTSHQRLSVVLFFLMEASAELGPFPKGTVSSRMASSCQVEKEVVPLPHQAYRYPVGKPIAPRTSGSGCWRVKDNLSTSPIGKYQLSATLLLLVNIYLLHSCLFLQSLKTNEALLLLWFNMKAVPRNQKNHKNVMFLAKKK